MTLKLAGKTAFVTGAGSGMGRAIAIAFAREGANVVAVDLKLESAEETIAQITANGDNGLAAAADVSDKVQVEGAVAAGLERFGGYDVLVNNAGIFDNKAPLLELSDELRDRVLGVDLLSAFIVTKAVLPHIISAGGGTVVTTASIAGQIAGAGGAAYTTAKHGILGFTKQLAFDYAKQGVRANAICPGSIETGLTKPFWEIAPESKQRSESVPMGRVGTPEEIARLAVFLASEDSSFITGIPVPIDGGYTLN